MASEAIRIALVLWVVVGFHGMAWAQTGYMVQGGSVARGHAPVAIQSGAPGAAIYGDGGPALAGAFSEIGISASGTPFCINDQVPSSPGLPPNGPYHQLCLGANSLGGGLISYNAYNGATPLTLTCIINGSTSPCFGSGVAGQSPTQVGQIASFKNTAGTLIGEGPAGINDTQTGAITVTGSTLYGNTNPSFTADQILSYTFCTSPCLPLPAQGGGNYDAVRGVAVVNAGTTTPIVAGVSGYVLVNQAFTGVVPFGVTLFGTGAINVDSGRLEGMNVNISDNEFRSAQSGNHNRLMNGVEIDLSTSYQDTSATALLISGNSVLQSNATGGITLAYQNFSGTHGAIKWGQFLDTLNGATNTFGIIGTKAFVPNGGGGVTTNSQDTFWGAYIAGTGFQGQLTFGSAFTGGGAVTPSFSFNYPIETMTGGLIARSTTDQLLQLGGAVDYGSGASIESRNDINSTLEPLELLGDLIGVNGPFLLKNYITSALPTCNTALKFAVAAVTDASSPTYNGALTGSSSTVVPVFCNGSAWTTH